MQKKKKEKKKRKQTKAEIPTIEPK